MRAATTVIAVRFMGPPAGRWTATTTRADARNHGVLGFSLGFGLVGVYLSQRADPGHLTIFPGAMRGRRQRLASVAVAGAAAVVLAAPAVDAAASKRPPRRIEVK